MFHGLLTWEVLSNGAKDGNAAGSLRRGARSSLPLDAEGLARTDQAEEEYATDAEKTSPPGRADGV